MRLYKSENNIKDTTTDTNGIMLTDGVRHCDSNKVNEFLTILEEVREYSPSRCISVYRDVVIIGKDVYKICLSCGDYYKNNERFDITRNQKSQLREFIDSHFEE